jgi:hypothetical protein
MTGRSLSIAPLDAQVGAATRLAAAVAWCVQKSLLHFLWMRSSPWVGTLVAVLALAFQAKIARACVLEPTLLHRSDANLAQTDTAAPRAPVVVAAAAYRRSGLTCGQDVCVANNCGDLGGVAIDLAAGEDDQTPLRGIGYRLELVEGVVPEALQKWIGVDLAGPTPLRLQVAFDEVPSVDATLRVIAVDAAGNGSVPSAPFALSFDGCTLAATGERCETDYDADAEYAAASAGEDLDALQNNDLDAALGAVGPQPSLAGQGGCSLPFGAARGAGLGALLPLLLSWVAGRRRR